MQLDKQQIVDMLTNRGDQDQADRAQADLPDQVDTDHHADLLSRFNVDPADLGGGAGGTLGL